MLKVKMKKIENRKINGLSKDFKPKEKFLKNEDGTIITNRKDITSAWVDYFNQLLNFSEPQNPFHFEQMEPNMVEHPEPTK